MSSAGSLRSGSLDLRPSRAHPAILSGEIQQDGVLENNAYHILIANTNGILDGFTLTGGAANGPNWYCQGGAIYATNVGFNNTACRPQIIANCIFTNNVATNGGALYGYYSALLITNCLFAKNAATNGGAVYVHNFTGNYRIDMVDTIFRQNNSVSQGGAIYADAFQTWRLDGCKFIANSTRGSGGAISHTSSWTANPGLANCLFVGNIAVNNGGAIRYGNPGLHVRNSIFVGNISSNGSGGAIEPFNMDPVYIFDSVFAGNESKGDGGAVSINARRLEMTNCLFVGNVSTNGNGGGISISLGWAYKPALIGNVTFSGNRAKKGGAMALNNTDRPTTNINGIIWGNTASVSDSQIYMNASGTNTFWYTDIEGGWSLDDKHKGGSNIDIDPLFAGGPVGTWTAVGVYDESVGQTVLTDSAAAWTQGQLAGLFINTDNSQYRQFLIYTNTATTITVWGNAASFTGVGDAYQVWDYHLQSTGGRWTPLNPDPADWVADGSDSPCLDAGDPASVFTLEPSDNGLRINMGCYGNTAQASKASKPYGTIFLVQ